MDIKPIYNYYCYTGPTLPISKKVFKDMESCLDHIYKILEMRDPKISKRQAYKEITVIKFDIEKCPAKFKIFKNTDGLFPPLPKIPKNLHKKTEERV